MKSINLLAERKKTPMFSGLLKYFPLALEEVSRNSYWGNIQHNKNAPLHWDREKSADHLDCVVRHLTDHAKGKVFDDDGQRHLTKAAWRCLAELQLDLEKEIERITPSRPTRKPYSIEVIKKAAKEVKKAIEKEKRSNARPKVI
jgi:hypothetical protein